MPSYATSLRNARADSITTEVGSAGVLRIYDGTPPASVGAALSGNTLLAELVMGSPMAPAASGGVLTLNAISNDSSANATGTATFCRLFTSGGTAKVQGTVGTSGAFLNMNTVSFVAGAVVSITSATITEGNA